MRPSRLFAGVLLPLLLLGAKKPREPEPPPPPSATEILRTMKLDTTVALLDPGAEPRRVVRFVPRPGASATVEMTQRSATSMTLNGQSMEMPAAETVTTSRYSVGRPDGEGVVRVRVEEVGGTALGGMNIELLVSPEGQLTSFAMLGGDPETSAMIEGLGESISRSLPQLPTEALGVGARWRTELSFDMAGLAFTAETTSVVTGLSDTSLDLALTTTLRKGESASPFPGLPPGAELSIRRFEGAGSGTQRIDLVTLATTTDQRLTLDFEMAATMPDAPEGMETMNVAMRVDQVQSSRVVGP